MWFRTKRSKTSRACRTRSVTKCLTSELQIHEKSVNILRDECCACVLLNIIKVDLQRKCFSHFLIYTTTTANVYALFVWLVDDFACDLQNNSGRPIPNCKFRVIEFNVAKVLSLKSIGSMLFRSQPLVKC